MNTGTNVANALKEPWKIAAAMTEPDLTRINCAIGARQIQKTIIINTPVTGWAGKLCPIRMSGACHNPHIAPIITAVSRKFFPENCRSKYPRQPASSPKANKALMVIPPIKPLAICEIRRTEYDNCLPSGKTELTLSDFQRVVESQAQDFAHKCRHET